LGRLPTGLLRAASRGVTIPVDSPPTGRTTSWTKAPA